MRQDRKSLSLMDMPDLPVEAFRHVGNRKIKLHGGGNPISDLVDGIGDAISDIGSAIDDTVNDIIPGGWATVAAVTLIACGIPDPELLALAEEGSLTTAELEAAGYDALTVAETAASVSPEVVATTEAAMASGVSPEMLAMANATADPIAALNAAAGWTASDAAYLMSIGYTGAIIDPITGVATDVSTAAKAQTAGWESAGGAHGAEYVDPSGTYYGANGQPVAYTQPDGSVLQAGQTAGSSAGQLSGGEIVHAENGVIQNGVRGDMVTYADGTTEFVPNSVAPAAAPVAPAAPTTQTVVNSFPFNQGGVEGTYNVFAEGGGEFIPNAAAAPANTIPVTLGDGSVGAFDPATGTVYDAAGAVDTAATETMQTAASGSTAGPGTQLAEAAKDTGVVSDAPFRVEVTGAAGTAEAPSFVTGPLSDGAQLATNAEIDAGVASWNAGANAWEVSAVPAELSPVVPGEVISGAGGGAVSTIPEVVVTAPGAGLTAAQTAALGAGGLAATGALAGGGAGAGAATLPPVVDATPVPAGPATGPVAPGPSSPATVVTPGGDVVATTTTPPVEAPLSPVQSEVIPAGSSTVASVTAPPAGITTAAEAAAAGFDAATVAKWVAAGLVAKALLTPPAMPTAPGYGPLNKHYPMGTADKVVNPGLNPGWITAQPFYKTTNDVQAQYYWGNHPYVETPADLANWNNIPYAPTTPWGLQQAQAPFDVNTYIRQTMTPQQQAALAGSAPQYYAPIAPVSPTVGS